MMLSKKLITAVLFILMLAVGGLQAGGDATRGADLAVDCADCHGDGGKGDEDTPGIAGLDEAEHVKALQDFKSGARVDEDEMMFDYVEDLSDQDMADLAAYYASLPGE